MADEPEIEDVYASHHAIGADDLVDDIEVNPLETPGEWSKELGFPDPYGVLRIWVDDDDLITKVRITPIWREKLGRTPLSQAFGITFTFINNYRGPADATVADDPLPTHGVPPLSAENLQMLSEQMAAVASDLDAFGPADYGRWVGTPAEGSVVNDAVVLSLDEHGRLSGVRFDPDWLESATVRNVSLAVVQAHRAARQNWRPPTYQPGPADELRQRWNDLRMRKVAMVMGGFSVETMDAGRTDERTTR